MRSLTSFLILTALGAASGCSSSSPSDAAASGDATGPSAPISTASSGSRLKAKFLAAEGVRQHVGWHDSMRNEDCTFQPAEAGHIRCLPQTLSASPNGIYSDPACKVPIAVAGACGSDAKYAIVVTQSNGCGTAGTSTELRKTLDPKSPVYNSSGSAGGCAIGVPPPLGRQPPIAPSSIVPLGDVVPWTDFVEANETNVPSAIVTERVFVATDGTRQHAGFHDDGHGVDCSFQGMADGFTRCVPEAGAGPVSYADSHCTTPLYVDDPQFQGGGCAITPSPGKDLWVEPPLEACLGIRAVYALGAYGSGTRASGDGVEVFGWRIDNVSSGPSSTPSAPTCESNGTFVAGQSSSQRPISANLSGSLPTVPRVASGTGRLVPALVWPPGIDTKLVAGWHDTMQNVDCLFALASDGKMRCLPVASSATLVFTDTKCKSASLAAALSDVECVDPTHFATTTSTTCPSTTTVYALGATPRTLTSASLITSDGVCATTTGSPTGTGSASGFTVRDATPVDPSQFALGTPAND